MGQKVNNFKRRDEMYKNRLSSFLLNDGGLTASKISAVKAGVFYVETAAEEPLILKRHRKWTIVKQQWDFFEQLKNTAVIPFHHYPNGKKIITQDQSYWTISPFISGAKLRYKHKKDRDAAVHILHRFHADARGIHVARPVSKDLFFVRWERRLQSFIKTEQFFKENGFDILYKDIIQSMHFYLKQVQQLSWEKREREAQLHGHWLHGDVAAHNFIQGEQTYLLDFDLLACGSQLYDYIQLGQRFLPFIDWDLDELLACRMVAEKDMKKWLTAIFVPSDIIREWLFFLSQGSSGSVKQYLAQMEKMWMKRQFFLKNAGAMLKSM